MEMEGRPTIQYSPLLRLQNLFVRANIPSYFLRFISWTRYYICFCKAAAFVSGLVFSHKLVDFAVLRVLITYFSDSLMEMNLKKAAIFTSAQEGLSAILVIFATWISYNSSIYPLRIMICSTAFYTMALWLLYFAASHKFAESIFDLFNIIGMILLTLGEAGVKPFLGTFLADQLRDHEQRKINDDQREDQITAQKMVWWRLAWCCSVVAAGILMYKFDWPSIFKWIGVAMGSSFVLFLLGIRSYHCKEITFGVSPFIILRVVKASLKKKQLNYPSSTYQFYRNDSGNQLHLSPRVKFFRWLDKAAIIESSTTLGEEEQAIAGTLYTVKQVRDSKLILTLVPMWTSFLVFGLVLSAGECFFPEQGSEMKYEEYMILLLIFQPISRKAISYLSELLISKWIPESKRRQAQVFRILVGMMISTFCCTVAWRVEVHRLNIILWPQERRVSMSIFWLLPQFCLLGLMQGLAADGLDEFVRNHFPEWTGDHAIAINEFVIKIGSLLNILFILANKSLFASTLNQSRLDKYYMRLTVVSFVNLCYNWSLSTYYAQSEEAE